MWRNRLCLLLFLIALPLFSDKFNDGYVWQQMTQGEKHAYVTGYAMASIVMLQIELEQGYIKASSPMLVYYDLTNLVISDIIDGVNAIYSKGQKYLDVPLHLVLLEVAAKINIERKLK
jgi:hypothetical protein